MNDADPDKLYFEYFVPKVTSLKRHLKNELKKNQEIIPTENNIMIVSIVTEETVTGNQTGAIHGTGIRNRTSVVVNPGGHLIRI